MRGPGAKMKLSDSGEQTPVLRVHAPSPLADTEIQFKSEYGNYNLYGFILFLALSTECNFNMQVHMYVHISIHIYMHMYYRGMKLIKI